MNPTTFHLLCCMFAAALVLIAAVHDLKWRLIPNMLTIPSIVFALFVHSVHTGWGGFLSSLLGLLIGGGVFLVFYLAGGMGAGDVKLMGAVGSILGLNMIFSVLAFTAIIGGFMAIFQLARTSASRRLTKHFNQYVLEAEPVNTGVPREHTDTERSTLPYGVAIALGTFLTLILKTLIEGGA